MTIDVHDGKIQKRKAPISKKKCDNCLRIFNVPSSKQFCKDKTCEGLLELIAKEKKETTKEPPRCDKHCKKCFSWYLKVPCATKKCKCGHTLSKIVWPPTSGKNVNDCGIDIFIDPVD